VETCSQEGKEDTWYPFNGHLLALLLLFLERPHLGHKIALATGISSGKQAKKVKSSTDNIQSCVGVDGRRDPIRIAGVIQELDADVVGL
jgi:hypothetical protein